jgi:hypothetical protein
MVQTFHSFESIEEQLHYGEKDGFPVYLAALADLANMMIRGETGLSPLDPSFGVLTCVLPDDRVNVMAQTVTMHRRFAIMFDLLSGHRWYAMTVDAIGAPRALIGYFSQMRASAFREFLYNAPPLSVVALYHLATKNPLQPPVPLFENLCKDSKKYIDA